MQKNSKSIGESIEIQCRKPLKMHAKIHSNSSRNQCRNSFKINAQIVPEMLAENIEKHAFLKGENMQIRRKGHRIWRFCQVGARTLKMHPKTFPKSMEIDATFVLKRAMKITWKRVPKRMPKLNKICPKTVQKLTPKINPKKDSLSKSADLPSRPAAVPPRIRFAHERQL